MTEYLRWFFLLGGGLLLGIALAILWCGKSDVRKPRKHRGKREYYTNGQVLMQRIKYHAKGGK